MAPHIHEKIDFTVEVFVVYRDKVLLRMHDKLKIWLSVGGHIELDEDPNEAALREVREEVGLDIDLFDSRTWEPNDDDVWHELLPPVSVGRHRMEHSELPQHEHVTFVYFAKAKTDTIVVYHEDDRSDEWRWFTKEELETIPLRANIRVYAQNALKALEE